MVEIFELAKAYPGAGLAWAGVVGVGVYFTLVWLAVGRDPKPGLVVPVYRPPDNLQPAEMRYLFAKLFDEKTLASALLSLAAKGYVSIRIADDGIYSLAFKHSSEPLSEAETCVLKAEGAIDFRIVPQNHTKIQTLLSALESSLKKQYQSLFSLNLAFSLFGFGVMVALMIAVHFISGRPFTPQSIGSIVLTCWCFFLFIVPLDLLQKGKTLWAHRVRILVTAMLGAMPLLVIGVFSSRPFFQTVDPISALTTIAVLIMLCLTAQFAVFLFAPTRLGQDLIDQIAGFRLYLSKTEIPRLNFDYPAGQTPPQIDPLLAYALALDCEQPWAMDFASMLALSSQAPTTRPPPAKKSFRRKN